MNKAERRKRGGEGVKKKKRWEKFAKEFFSLL